MSVTPKGTKTTPSPLHDDLERYINETSEADPRFKQAIEDAEDLQRLLDCLTALRHDRKISQTEVAHRMGVRQPTVSEFEKMSSDPKLSTLQRYARAIDARIRIMVATSAPCHWSSPSTFAYARGDRTPPVVRTRRDRSLVPIWKASRRARYSVPATA